MSVRAFLLLSSVHSLGLGLDLGNSLDRREGVSVRALIHELQSFKKKSDGSYLTTPHSLSLFFFIASKLRTFQIL